MTRKQGTLHVVKCQWNKKLEALGLPRISRETTDLPRTFAEYLSENHPDNKTEKPESTGNSNAKKTEAEGIPSDTIPGMPRVQCKECEELKIKMEKLTQRVEELEKSEADNKRESEDTKNRLGAMEGAVAGLMHRVGKNAIALDDLSESDKKKDHSIKQIATHMDQVQSQCKRDREDSVNMTNQLSESVRQLGGTVEEVIKAQGQAMEMIADVAASVNMPKREESAQRPTAQVNTYHGPKWDEIVAEAEAYRDTYNVEGNANTEPTSAPQAPDAEEYCVFERLKNPLTQMDRKTIKAPRQRYATSYKSTRPQSTESQQAARAIARTGIT